jgi:hypothetical protein
MWIFRILIETLYGVKAAEAVSENPHTYYLLSLLKKALHLHPFCRKKERE